MSHHPPNDPGGAEEESAPGEEGASKSQEVGADGLTKNQRKRLKEKQKKLIKIQTTPPSIPVFQLYPNGDFPIGECTLSLLPSSFFQGSGSSFFSFSSPARLPCFFSAKSEIHCRLTGGLLIHFSGEEIEYKNTVGKQDMLEYCEE